MLLLAARPHAGVPVKPMLAKICEGLPDVLRQLKGAPFMGGCGWVGQAPALWQRCRLCGEVLAARGRGTQGIALTSAACLRFLVPLGRCCRMLQPSSSTTACGPRSTCCRGARQPASSAAAAKTKLPHVSDHQTD